MIPIFATFEFFGGSLEIDLGVNSASHKSTTATPYYCYGALDTIMLGLTELFESLEKTITVGKGDRKGRDCAHYLAVLH